MLTTIGLDDQSGLTANEIGHVRADAFLPHKLEAAETPVAQAMPQSPLGLGLVAPQLPPERRALAGDRAAHRPHPLNAANSPGSA